MWRWPVQLFGLSEGLHSVKIQTLKVVNKFFKSNLAHKNFYIDYLHCWPLKFQRFNIKYMTSLDLLPHVNDRIYLNKKEFLGLSSSLKKLFNQLFWPPKIFSWRSFEHKSSWTVWKIWLSSAKAWKTWTTGKRIQCTMHECCEWCIKRIVPEKRKIQKLVEILQTKIALAS